MSLEVTRAMVAAIDKKDHYTSGHSERVGFLTRLIAAELGVSVAEQQAMEWAGLLHDVGKIGIPEEILCKPGKLTPRNSRSSSSTREWATRFSSRSPAWA
jgi:HD-GYP domain-containing protein (c-di-GMP phosphodiesterase class II)